MTIRTNEAATSPPAPAAPSEPLRRTPARPERSAASKKKRTAALALAAPSSSSSSSSFDLVEVDGRAADAPPSSSAPSASKRPRRRRRAKDDVVPLAEMRRLMDAYGPLKCVRERRDAKGRVKVGRGGGGTGTGGAGAGGEGGGGGESATGAKVDSIRRKFYRWFPDLDERFRKSPGGGGRYEPKAGHDAEVRYRKEMRANDGKVLAKKRARCRLRNWTAADDEAVERCDDDGGRTTILLLPTPLPVLSASSSDSDNGSSSSPPPVSPVPSAPPSLAAPKLPKTASFCAGGGSDDADEIVDLGIVDLTSMAAEEEAEEAILPVVAYDASFVPGEGIFDDVETCFYGPKRPRQSPPEEAPALALSPDCPSVTSASSSSQSSSSSEEASSSDGSSSNASEAWEAACSEADPPSSLDRGGPVVDEDCEEVTLVSRAGVVLPGIDFERAYDRWI